MVTLGGGWLCVGGWLVGGRAGGCRVYALV